jgi:hypothetical protein
MAKRVAPEEKPYSPVQEALARDVLVKRPPRPAEDARPPLAVVEGAEAEPVPPAPPAPPVAFPPPAAAPAAEASDPAPGPAPRTAKKRDLTREKRMLLTRDEERELDRLIDEISDELGVRVKVSNVMRASVALLFNVREELTKQCRRAKFSKRPRNGDPTEIANFEENLARLFESAVRNTRHRD